MNNGTTIFAPLSVYGAVVLDVAEKTYHRNPQYFKTATLQTMNTIPAHNTTAHPKPFMIPRQQSKS